MTEMQILDIIRLEHRAAQLPLPAGLASQARTPARDCWVRIARRIVSDCDTERRQAARHASLVGFSVTRGRVR